MTVLFKNIRFLRIRRGLTLADFEQYGIKQGTMSNYELGKTEPKLDTVLFFSKFFRVRVDDLISADLEILDREGENKRQENAIPKMQSQNAISKHQNAIPKRHPQNRHIEYDDSLSHLTGDFAAPDSEPAGEKVYIALLEAKDRAIAAKDEIIRAKDEIIATKEARIIDLRSFVDDMRKQTAVVQSNLDELREAMREVQKATKKASVVHDAEDVVASRK